MWTKNVIANLVLAYAIKTQRNALMGLYAPEKKTAGRLLHQCSLHGPIPNSHEQPDKENAEYL